MPVPQISSLNKAEGSVAAPGAASKRLPINIPFAAVIVALVAYGLCVVYSATYGNADYSFNRQAATVAVGAVIMLVLWRFDYRHLSGFTMLFMVINVVLILSPHIPGLGISRNGANSWINLGMQLQPGEFAKITVVLLAASVMAKYGGKLEDAREYLKTLLILAVPFVCILTQPDLGTGLVYLFISAVALIMGGAKPKYLLITLGVCVAAVALLLVADEALKTPSSNGTYEYHILKNYQRERFLVFLNPDADTSDSGYNLQQAQIAIGSGGVWGKGFMQGTQASLNFLPEAPTDFIFCVLAEEFGFMGVLVLLALYAALFYILIHISRTATNMFGMLIVACIAGMWLFQVLENIGMDLGIMPITGIPLPFMSYGSSFMLVNFVMLGLAGSVWAHNSLMRGRD